MVGQLPDEALVAGYKNAAGSALAVQYANELFGRYHLRIARWCLRFAGDRESAADLAQEICAKAYVNLRSFQNDSKFSTWLYAIARNHCLNALRGRADQPVEDSEEILAAMAAPPESGPEQALQRENAARVVRSLLDEALDDTEKQVFTLHFGEELPLDVITRVLALRNASGAKAYIVSARRKLRRAVERWRARTAAPTHKERRHGD